MIPVDKPPVKCSKCGKEINVNIEPSENWEYYCAECGLAEALKEIKKSKEYYDDKNKPD